MKNLRKEIKMEVICNESEKVKLQKVNHGDFIFLDAGNTGAISHWAIMTIFNGIVDCEYGGGALSDATKNKEWHLGDRIQYWQITKIAKSVEIKECISL
jgi:hypothetical protein